MSEYVIDLPNGGAADESIRLFHGAKMLYGYDLHERIVRCRDCESFHRWDVSAIYGNHEHDTFFCSRFIDGMRMEVEPDGFCKWGRKRKEQR